MNSIFRDKKKLFCLLNSSSFICLFFYKDKTGKARKISQTFWRKKTKQIKISTESCYLKKERFLIGAFKRVSILRYKFLSIDISVNFVFEVFSWIFFFQDFLFLELFFRKIIFFEKYFFVKFFYWYFFWKIFFRATRSWKNPKMYCLK